MKRSLVPLCLALCFSCVVTGCSKSETKGVKAVDEVYEELEDAVAEQEDAENQENATDQEEEEVSQIGAYRLEECENGLYVAYEDGSFDRLPADGFCRKDYYFETVDEYVYMRDDDVKKNLELSKNGTVVVFSETDYVAELRGVYSELSVLYGFFENVDGKYSDNMEGEGFAFPIEKEESGNLRVCFLDGSEGKIEIDFIDGMLVNDYQGERSAQTSPYDSRFEEIVIGLEKGATVSIESTKGTKLLKSKYEVNATQFDCDFLNREEAIFYDIQSQLTEQGYAVLDFSEIPSGRYVLILHDGYHESYYNIMPIDIVNE